MTQIFELCGIRWCFILFCSSLQYRSSKITPSLFVDKASCTRQFESELSLHSLASLFPIKEGVFSTSPSLQQGELHLQPSLFNSLYDPFGSPCRGQKPQKEGCKPPYSVLFMPHLSLPCGRVLTLYPRRVCHKSMAHPLLCYLLYNPRSIVAYSKKGII